MSIYKSHTHGAIPLSVEGKRLMHSLRVAINDAIQAADYNCQDKVAHARGELAKYMSELEKRPAPAVAMTATEVNIRAQTNPFTVDWNAGYDKLLADMRKDWYQSYRYGGSLKENVIQGMRPTMMLIDDPINEQELDMSKKAVAARKRTEKTLTKVRAAKAAKFMPVGIRFLHGPSLAQIYTYKAKRAAKLTLGQEVVVRNSRGITVGVVVTLDDVIPNGWALDTLTELTHKVAAL